jgi:hypothetical protein
VGSIIFGDQSGLGLTLGGWLVEGRGDEIISGGLFIEAIAPSSFNPSVDSRVEQLVSPHLVGCGANFRLAHPSGTLQEIPLGGLDHFFPFLSCILRE